MIKYKKLIIILLGILVFTVGCNSESTTNSNEEVDTVNTEEINSKDNTNETETETEEEVVREETNEKRVEEELNTQFNKLYDEELVTTDLIAFIDENIENIDTELATNWIDKLELKLDENLPLRIDRVFQQDPDNELMDIDGQSKYFSEEKINDIQNEKLKKEIEDNFNTFHRLVNIEGAFYPIVDYQKLSKYNEFINEDLSEYINIMGLDSEMIPFSDGARIITIEDLKNRILESEVYLTNYPNGIREEKITDNYRNKLTFFMGGLPNTPIYNYDNNIIISEIMDIFQETAALQNLVTGQTLGKYIEDIENNDNIVDEEILSKVEGYVEESINTIKSK